MFLQIHPELVPFKHSSFKSCEFNNILEICIYIWLDLRHRTKGAICSVIENRHSKLVGWIKLPTGVSCGVNIYRKKGPGYVGGGG